MSLIQPFLNAYMSDNEATRSLRKPMFTLNTSLFKDMLPLAYQNPFDRPLFNIPDTSHLYRTMQTKFATMTKGNFQLWGEAAATFRACEVHRYQRLVALLLVALIMRGAYLFPRRAQLAFMPPLALVGQRTNDNRKLPVWMSALWNIHSGLFAQWIAWPIFDSWMAYYRLPLKARRRFMYTQLYDPRLRNALRQYRYENRAFGGPKKDLV